MFTGVQAQGGYSGFYVTGMIGGFFFFLGGGGVEIFDSGIFLSRKIWQVFCLVA